MNLKEGCVFLLAWAALVLVWVGVWVGIEFLVGLKV